MVRFMSEVEVDGRIMGSITRNLYIILVYPFSFFKVLPEEISILKEL